MTGREARHTAASRAKLDKDGAEQLNCNSTHIVDSLVVASWNGKGVTDEKLETILIYIRRYKIDVI